MKISEVSVNPTAGYEITPAQRQIAELGRVLMDRAVTTKDDELSNTMAKVGSSMTEFGSAWGPRNLDELLKATGVDAAMLKKLLAYAQQEFAKSGPVRKSKEVPADDEDDDKKESSINEGPQQMDVIGYNSGQGLPLAKAVNDPKHRRKVNVVELSFSPYGAPQLKFKELNGDGPFIAEYDPTHGWHADFD